MYENITNVKNFLSKISVEKGRSKSFICMTKMFIIADIEDKGRTGVVIFVIQTNKEFVPVICPPLNEVHFLSLIHI